MSPVPSHPAPTALEHGDRGRSHVFATAALPDGPLDVDRRAAPGRYPGLHRVTTRDPGELFVLFGVHPEAEGADGAQLARLDADTLAERWRVRLLDTARLRRWNHGGSLGLLDDGDLLVVVSDRVFRIEPRSSEILTEAILPTGDEEGEAIHLGYAPLADGRLAMTTVHRAGTRADGARALLETDLDRAPASRITVFDPRRWTVVESVDGPEPIGGPVAASGDDGTDLLWLAGRDHLHRWRWRDGELGPDHDWTPVPVRPAGRSGPAGVVVAGAHAVVVTNGTPALERPALLAVPTTGGDGRTHEPFGPGADDLSFVPALAAVDPDTARAIVADAGLGLVAAVDLAQGVAVWRADLRTTADPVLVGSAASRTLVTTHVAGPDGYGDLADAATEDVVWLDAATGTERVRATDLARSGPGVMVTPTGDGRFHHLALDGTLTELTVRSPR